MPSRKAVAAVIFRLLWMIWLILFGGTLILLPIGSVTYSLD